MHVLCLKKEMEIQAHHTLVGLLRLGLHRSGEGYFDSFFGR